MNDRKLKIELWLAVGLVVFGCLMLSAGFIVAPLGVIHSSVLVAFGEICTFAGALLGIDYHKNKVLQGITDRTAAKLSEEDDKVTEN